MTFHCPRGHESTDSDYCSVCGIIIPARAAVGNGVTSTAPVMVGGIASPAAPTLPANSTVCPVCATPRSDPDLRFCEVCRYDFQTDTPSPATNPPPLAAPAGAPSALTVHAPYASGVDDPNDPFAADFAALEAAAIPASANTASPFATHASGSPATSVAPAVDSGGNSVIATPDHTPSSWEVRVSVDPTLDTDPDPDVSAPQDEPEYFYPLTEIETLIGRRDDRQGIRPHIPLRDPGASRRHAMLRIDADGLTVMDLGSTNGTLVNGVEVPPNSRRVLKEGDVITVGRWTSLTLKNVLA